MSIFPILGSIVGGLLQSSSARRAARAQTDAANRQIDLQQRIYEEQKDLFSPFVGAGTNALAAINYELGLGPRPTFGGAAPEIMEITDTPQQPADNLTAAQRRRLLERNEYVPPSPQASAPVTRYSVNGNVFNTRDAAQAYANANRTGGAEYQGFKASPGYDFRLTEGINAIDRSAASSGGLFSGNTMKAAQRYGEGLAADEYNAFYNRLAGVAGSGQNAAGMQGAAAQNYASGASNALANIGNAQSAGAIGAGNALNSGIGNAIGIWQYQNAVNPGGITANAFSAPWASKGFWG